MMTMTTMMMTMFEHCTNDGLMLAMVTANVLRATCRSAVFATAAVEGGSRCVLQRIGYCSGTKRVVVGHAQ